MSLRTLGWLALNGLLGLYGASHIVSIIVVFFSRFDINMVFNIIFLSALILIAAFNIFKVMFMGADVDLPLVIVWLYFCFEIMMISNVYNGITSIIEAPGSAILPILLTNVLLPLFIFGCFLLPRFMPNQKMLWRILVTIACVFLGLTALTSIQAAFVFNDAHYVVYRIFFILSQISLGAACLGTAVYTNIFEKIN